jgi:hypothetical protein
MNTHDSDNDYILFPPQPQTMYPPELFGMDAAQFVSPVNTDYTYPRTVDEAFTSIAGYNSALPDYADSTHFAIANNTSPEIFHTATPDLRAPLSTASGRSVPSASSSATGSPIPQSYGPPFPDWNQAPAQGLGFAPSIVQYDSYGHEYNPMSGMDHDFVFPDFHSKPNGFVGECAQLPSSSHALPPQFHSFPRTVAAAPRTADPGVSKRRSASSVHSTLTTSAMLPQSPSMNVDDVFKTPTTPASATMPSRFGPFSSPLTNNHANSFYSPSISSVHSPANNAQNYHLQSPFFSQSSGHFVAPLGSSCWFSPHLLREYSFFKSFLTTICARSLLTPLLYRSRSFEWMESCCFHLGAPWR